MSETRSPLPTRPDADAPFSPIRWEDGHLMLLDQTRLPDAEAWLDCADPEQVADAIRRLAGRGAPAIGVAAAYGPAVGVRAAAGGGGRRRRGRRGRGARRSAGRGGGGSRGGAARASGGGPGEGGGMGR